MTPETPPRRSVASERDRRDKKYSIIRDWRNILLPLSFLVEMMGGPACTALCIELVWTSRSSGAAKWSYFTVAVRGSAGDLEPTSRRPTPQPTRAYCAIHEAYCVESKVSKTDKINGPRGFLKVTSSNR